MVKYAGMQRACRVYLKWVRHGRYRTALGSKSYSL
jgi:hypothetical protein